MRQSARVHRSGALAAALWAALAVVGCGDERRSADRASAPRAAPASAQAPADASSAQLPAPPPVVAAASRPPSPSPSSPLSPPPAQNEVSAPTAGSLLIPVPGVEFAQLRDSFDDVRGTARHEALDIIAPRGTPVRAVADGRVVKLFTSVPGGLTVYQFDTGRTVAYYYAHLDRYADGLREGMDLKRGDPIGSVGSTGNAASDAPHLHFAVFVLGPQRQWWKGTPINPYPLFATSR